MKQVEGRIANQILGVKEFKCQSIKICTLLRPSGSILTEPSDSSDNLLSSQTLTESSFAVGSPSADANPELLDGVASLLEFPS